MNVPADLKYTDSHEWMRAEADGTVTVGITDHAQAALGDLVFIELPAVGRKLAAGEACAVVESVKAASDVYAPIAGEVVAVQRRADGAPETVNADAYGAWLFRLKPADAGALAGDARRRGVRKADRRSLIARIRGDEHERRSPPHADACRARGPRGVRRAPHRHDAADQAAMLARAGLSVARRADRRDRARGDPRARAAAAAGPDARGRGARAAAGDRRARTACSKSFIGQGYYGTHTPGVILRNILENPAWYTAYTPYQPEISQGRLEALVNFQTMVCDLTGMAIANASMLDEATAAAEAMTLRCASARATSRRFFVADDVFPQTLDVVRTRAAPLGIDVVVGPGERGARARRVRGAAAVSRRERRRARLPRAGRRRSTRRARSCRRRRPARADAARAARRVGRRRRSVGSTQRFGVPMGYGGPHAGYLATRDEFKRSLPGRLVGVTVDAQRQPRVPARAADARAAHPPREGDVEHLHGAGAAGGDREHVRRLSRPGRPDAHRAARASADRDPARRGSRGSASRVPTRRVLRHAHRGHGRAHAARSSRAASRTASTSAAIDAATLGISLDETTTRDDVERIWRVFDGRRRAVHRRRRSMPRSPTRCRRRSRARRRSSRIRCSTATTPRPRCCATCAGSPTATSRSTAR